MNESATCSICTRDLWDDEHGRQICRPCEKHIDRTLQSIAGPTGLYARLALRTQPGKHASGPTVSGTRGSGMPPNEMILNMVANGGIVSDLETWVKDWAAYGLATTSTGSLQYRVDQAVRTLRLNLPQAAYRHPALKDFKREIDKITRRSRALIDGEQPPIQIRVTCTCGHTIPTSLATDGETCKGCGTDYQRYDIVRMPIAEKRTAA